MSHTPAGAPAGLAVFSNQPKAVWATAFATMVGFTSIGLVDPILTSIAEGLHAGPSQVSLLFTSYFFVTALMMLVTGFVSSRLGGRKTLLVGSALIVVFAGLAGTSDSVAELVAFRAGWGLGNAFFVVTALAVIVAATKGGMGAAILMYEAALGLGISVGPLIGAALGDMSWRYPFYGTAALMLVAFLAILAFLPEQPRPPAKVGLGAPLAALKDRGLLLTASSAFLYYLAFFTVLAFVPFVLAMSAHAIGLIFFGWGVALAISSVFATPRLQARFGTLPLLAACLTAFALLLVAIALGSKSLIVAAVVVSGAASGIVNTLYTEIALSVSDQPRPVASAAYNFLRWFAGVVAPFAAPHIAEVWGHGASFALAALAALGAALLLLAFRARLGRFGERPRATAKAAAPAPVPAAGLVMAAIDGSDQDEAVVDAAASMAAILSAELALVHVATRDIALDALVEAEDGTLARAVIERAERHLAGRATLAAGYCLFEDGGNAAAAILNQALAAGAGLVVVGRRHRLDVTDLMHGSVADIVSHRAHCPVLVVPGR